MHADSAFTIGASHLVCEDYTLHTNDCQITVCDGCSSSRMTDVGARLLALAATRIIATMPTAAIDIVLNEIAMLLKYGIDKHSLFHYLPDNAFDVTLLMAREYDGLIRTIVVGDGVIVAKPKEGDVEVIEIIYPNNMPYYLSYEMDLDRKKLFEETEPWIEKRFYSIDPVSGVLDRVDVTDTGGQSGLNAPYESVFDVEDYDWVGLMSDGVQSFSDADRNTVPASDVIAELTNFKTFTGQFVQRRLNRFKKDCVKYGWVHHDDLSIAVLHTGEV